MLPRPSVVVFDIGNVPARLGSPADLLPQGLRRPSSGSEWFLVEVCTPRLEPGAGPGPTFAAAVAERIALFPDMASEIRAYDERWLETLSGAIQGSVDILNRLRAAGVPNYAITNFSAEKFVDACLHFPFLAGSTASSSGRAQGAEARSGNLPPALRALCPEASGLRVHRRRREKRGGRARRRHARAPLHRTRPVAARPRRRSASRSEAAAALRRQVRRALPSRPASAKPRHARVQRTPARSTPSWRP